MMVLPAILLLSLSIGCWASFALAIVWHFDRSAEPSGLMKSVVLLGTLFGLLQLAAMIWAPTTSMTFWMVALVLYASALTLFWWTVQTTCAHRFALAFTPTSPTMVLVEGPYRWVRHPFYASYLSYWLAGVCATEVWWMMVSVLVMGALYWRAAVQEETEFLRGDQAEAYRAYIVRTGRFFPKLRRSPEIVTEDGVAPVALMTK